MTPRHIYQTCERFVLTSLCFYEHPRLLNDFSTGVNNAQIGSVGWEALSSETGSLRFVLLYSGKPFSQPRLNSGVRDPVIFHFCVFRARDSLIYQSFATKIFKRNNSEERKKKFKLYLCFSGATKKNQSMKNFLF